MKRFRLNILWLLLWLILAVTSCGCAHLSKVLQGLQGLQKAQQFAQTMASVVEVSENAADTYFARHPHETRREEIEAALASAKTAVQVLDELLAAGADLKSESYTHVLNHAVAVYDQLHRLLDKYGVKDATPPEGGAETAAPLPHPVDLPTPDEMRALAGL